MIAKGEVMASAQRSESIYAGYEKQNRRRSEALADSAGCRLSGIAAPEGAQAPLAVRLKAHT